MGQLIIILFFLKLFGFTGYMGGGRYTRGIVLYDVEKHRHLVPEFSKARHSFKHKFIQHLPLVEEHFSYQMSKNVELLKKISGEKILLYLSSWEYNSNVDRLIMQYPDHLKIIKLHPHIRTNYKLNNFDFILNNDLFVEMFIIKATGICAEVVVLHEGSSAMQYIDSGKIKNIIL